MRFFIFLRSKKKILFGVEKKIGSQFRCRNSRAFDLWGFQSDSGTLARLKHRMSKTKWSRIGRKSTSLSGTLEIGLCTRWQGGSSRDFAPLNLWMPEMDSWQNSTSKWWSNFFRNFYFFVEKNNFENANNFSFSFFFQNLKYLRFFFKNKIWDFFSKSQNLILFWKKNQKSKFRKIISFSKLFFSMKK